MADVVSVERLIPAPASEIFDLIADPNRHRDIDGSGTNDIIYLHRNGVRLYFNQSGNRWSEPIVVHELPVTIPTRAHTIAAVT